MAKLAALPTAAQALPDRAQPIPTAVHFVNGHSLKPPFPTGLDEAVFPPCARGFGGKAICARRRSMDTR